MEFLELLKVRNYHLKNFKFGVKMIIGDKCSRMEEKKKIN